MRKLILLLALLPGVAGAAMSTHGLGTAVDENICTFEDSTGLLMCELAPGASGGIMLSDGAQFLVDLTPAINCTDCTNIPAVADLNDITSVTLTTPADGGVLCFSGAGNTALDCTLTGEVTAVETTGALTTTVAANHGGSVHHTAEVSATETVEGIVERATQAEVDATVDTIRYISPQTLGSFVLAGELGGDLDGATVTSTHSGSAHHTVFAPNADPVTDHANAITASTTDTLTNKTIDGGVATTTHAAGANIVSLLRHATDCTTITDGKAGEVCLELDAEVFYSCQPTAGDCDTAGEWILTPAGGAGEVNTHSSEAGGLALTATVPKVGVDLRLVAADSADFDRTGDVLEIDAAILAAHHAESHTVASHSDTTITGAETETLSGGADADALHTHDGKQPLDTELTLIAGLAETTGNVMIGVAGAWDSVAQPIIDCTNCTSIPAGTVADLDDITNVTLTTPADGASLCFTGAVNASVDCTVGGEATATEDAGVQTFVIAGTHSGSAHHTVFSPNTDPGVDHPSLSGGAGIAEAVGVISTASGETDFLASGALTCTTAQQGRAQVHTTPLQYCDNAATPALQYAAYADSSGLVTDFGNAADLNAGGTVNGTHSGTAHHTVFAPTAGVSTDHGATSVGDTDIAAAAVDGGTAGEIADGTVDGEDMNANYAGAHLTETAGSPDTLGVDAELTRGSACIYIEDPAAEDLSEVWQAHAAITVDRVWCKTEATTVTLNIENGDGAPADILSSDLVCDVGEQTSCASGCDVNTIAAAQDNIAQYDEVLVDISAIGASPGRVTLCWHWTVDDV